MKRILIVDDNEQNLYLLDVLLKGHGFAVDMARNGREALERAAAHLPSLIVSDILMPEMDGFTLCRHWKADATLTKIPFVFYTATYTEEQDREFGLSLGAERFVVKPADPEAFMALIQEVIEQETNRQEPTAVSQYADGDAAYLQTYSQALVRRLEAKMLNLERINGELSAFKEAVDRSAVGLLVINQERVVVWSSAFLGDLFGFEPADVEQKPYDEALGRHFRPHFVDGERFYTLTLSAIAQDMQVVRHEFELTVVANIQWVALRIAPITAGLYAGGHIFYFYDVTEAKQAAAQLRVREQQLQQTAQLEAMGRLASGMAHDFKNLLMVIGAYGGLLAKNPQMGSEKVASHADQIVQATAKAADLIKNLLTFGRQQELLLEVVDVNQIVERAIKLLTPLVDESVEIHVTLQEMLEPVEADTSQLERALLNLALNACDAMPSGGRLTIRTANLEVDELSGIEGLEAGHYVLILIDDTGLGMTDEIQAKIFEPFFTTKKDTGGTGLGLAMVHGTIMRLGGRIHLSSQPNRGTTFRIYLPVTDE